MSRRFEGAVLPGRHLGQVIASEVDPALWLQQAEVGLADRTCPFLPGDPPALAVAGPPPRGGEGGNELIDVGVAVNLAPLLERMRLAGQWRHAPERVSIVEKVVGADDDPVLAQVPGRRV